MTEGKKVAAVAGVGSGIGAALARRFAKAGHAVGMLARKRDTLDASEREIDGLCGYPCERFRGFRAAANTLLGRN